MLNKISQIDHDHEDDENLNKFVMQLRRFNYGVELPNGFEKRIFEFF